VLAEVGWTAGERPFAPTRGWVDGGRTAVRPYKRVFTTSGGVWELIVPSLTSRGEPRRAPVGYILFALTPSPSPTLWERGVGAHGGAPCGAFPIARLAGAEDTGGEGNWMRLPPSLRANRCTPNRQRASGMGTARYA